MKKLILLAMLGFVLAALAFVLAAGDRDRTHRHAADRRRRLRRPGMLSNGCSTTSERMVVVIIRVGTMRESILQIRRLSPSGGGLVLGPRPGKKSKVAMAGMDLTHVCTLLSERESPAAVERIALELGCTWVWLPVDGGSLETLQTLDVEPMVAQLARAIGRAPLPRIYLHCSAGIHRTGFFASLLLRLEPIDGGAMCPKLFAHCALSPLSRSATIGSRSQYRVLTHCWRGNSAATQAIDRRSIDTVGILRRLWLSVAPSRS
jgi:hypothetical protein